MIRPFKGTFPITQEWGVNPASYVQFGLKGHNGVDYGLPTGTPVYAPHSGKVIEAAFDAAGYGNYVKIENDKEGSILAHFQSFNVNAGDTVSEGQQVGVSDNTGNSTGPHLHWGYYRMPRNKTDGFSGTTNPFPYLSENNSTPSNPSTPSTEPSNTPSDWSDKEKKLNDAITRKDAQIKAIYLGLPEADKSIIDPDQQAKLSVDKILNLTTSKISIEKENLLVSQQLKECQQKPNTSLECQTNLIKLQSKFDKLKSTPSKAIISLLFAIAEKIGANV